MFMFVSKECIDSANKMDFVGLQFVVIDLLITLHCFSVHVHKIIFMFKYNYINSL